MNKRIGWIAAAAGLLAGCHMPEPGPAPRWMVSANDQQLQARDGDYRVVTDPRPGSLTLMDISAVPPRSVTNLEGIPCSLIGPPTCLAVTPNQRLALVASAMRIDPSDPLRQIPDNRLSVVRLKPGTPGTVQQIEVGRQPSGVEISRDGTRALVANRADGSVSLLAISADGNAGLIATFMVATPESNVSHAAFSPDGRHVLITLNKAGVVLFCSLENDRLEVLQKISAGNGPYCAEFTPDGRSAVIGNVFGGTLTVLNINDREAAVVDTIPVGILAEGLDISPDGQWMAVNCLENTAMKPDEPGYRETGMVVLLRKQRQTFVVVDSIRTGRIPQSAVFTPDGRFVAVGCTAEQNIAFYRIRNGQLSNTGIRIPVSGGPAAVRISPDGPADGNVLELKKPIQKEGKNDEINMDRNNVGLNGLRGICAGIGNGSRFQSGDCR
jgi:DNA-binding beta-propeller fold protein YncE